jgi:hypothetical protein
MKNELSLMCLLTVKATKLGLTIKTILSEAHTVHVLAFWRKVNEKCSISVERNGDHGPFPKMPRSLHVVNVTREKNPRPFAMMGVKGSRFIVRKSQMKMRDLIFRQGGHGPFR